ncbi:BrnA antitoxin family protein [Sphingomonas aerolata]|uniref:BrnA antitoxin family protein n=1 Tax=Sphingomonas aerolata TaxID=185951 RepID=UPI002FE08544
MGAGSGGRDGATRLKGCGLKQQRTERLDRSVLARIRDGGPGWQGRINGALRAAGGLNEFKS